MHAEIVDEEPREGEGVQIGETGAAQEHDDVPFGHEHHLALEVEAAVLLLAHQGPARAAVLSLLAALALREVRMPNMFFLWSFEKMYIWY